MHYNVLVKVITSCDVFSCFGCFQVGAEAPAFTVNDQNGVEVTLASFRGEKNVVVYFYPKDDTVSLALNWD